jgi:hypothetical protein
MALLRAGFKDYFKEREFRDREEIVPELLERDADPSNSSLSQNSMQGGFVILAQEVLMKRSTIVILSLILLAGCAPQETSQPVQAENAQQPAAEAEIAVPEGELSMHYMEAAAALGVDNFEIAKKALTELANASTGDLKRLAETAAKTGQIAAMRESFKPLSELASKMKLPPDYAVAFCPMYKGGSKWVQKRETLSNPYFGAAMATCGNFIN